MTKSPASTVVAVEFPRSKGMPVKVDGHDPVKMVPKPTALVDFVLTATELAALDIPPREYLVGGWIWRRSVTLVYAKRGLGKTWFTLALALAMAKGESFVGFEMFETLVVLFVDGEMVLGDTKGRIGDMAGGDIPENLSILSSERLTMADEPPLSLNEPETQRRFVELLEGMDPRPDVVIFDNLSALTGVAMDENSAKDVAPLMRFFTQLKHRGFTVIFVDHAGKDAAKGVRGSSKKQDAIDTSIVLVEVDGDHDTCVFKLKFDKTRGPVVKPREQVLTLMDDGHGNLGFSTSVPTYQKLDAVLQAVHDGRGTRNQAHVATAMNVSPGQVSKLLAKAREAGLVADGDKGLELTDKGRKEIGEMFD